MIVSVHQPHYLPYPGYLAKVALSGHFVFLEGVQYVRREWQNRNRVKAPEGAVWLTVPVSGEYGASIAETEIRYDDPWREKHLETLRRFYAKADYLPELDHFAEVLQREYASLAELTMATTSFFLDRFAVSTPRSRMADHKPLPETPDERIIALTKSAGGDTYLAGSGGRNYMELDKYEGAGIEVRFITAPQIVYPQLHGEFITNLGAIDLLLNHGPEGFDRYIRPQLGQSIDRSSQDG